MKGSGLLPTDLTVSAELFPGQQDTDEMKEKALPAHFGEWIKRYRKRLDLTQDELAQRVGCSTATLRKIEGGERRPSKQLASLLARSLEIPMEDQAAFIRLAREEAAVERISSPISIDPGGNEVVQAPGLLRTNLPAQPFPLIGRDAELVELGKLLAEPDCRLLTITGAGGVGKTRLAIELAFRERDSYPGGVYVVSLSSLNASEFIVPAVADVLKLTFSGPLEPKDQLLNFLAFHTSQPTLLVLDNLEHLLALSDPADGALDPVALLAEMLRRAPNVKILVTSRERINLQGEWMFELHGMPFPAKDQEYQLENFSATVFFVQRAQQAVRDFEVLPEEQPSLARICELVEGNPLAIELAAAWVRVLSIRDISREIASNLDFLTSSMRDVSERHRSLKATFEYSWKLLSAEERQGLSRLAVFRGGFQREAAEHVAGVSLTVLMSLFSKSLIQRQDQSRYDLHEVLRQYALSHLEEDPRENLTYDRHCHYYLGLVHGEEKGFSEANQWVGDQVLLAELDNLRAAMSWGLKSSQVQYTLQIATALGQFWYTHGYWREGLEWLDWGLTCPQPAPDLVRAKALTVAGRLTRYLGDYSQAIALLRESLVCWENCADQTGIAQSLCNLGAALFRQGDFEEALNLLGKALEVATQQVDRRGQYCSLENLGHAASRQGKPETAIEYYETSLALAREANDENQVANLLNAIGDEYMLLGDFDRAENFFSLAAEICRRLGNRLVGAYVSGNRGLIAIKNGNYTLAIGLLVESIRVLQEMGDKEEVILCFEPMAFMALEQRCPERAVKLLGADESLRQTLGVIRSQPLQADFDGYLADARKQLGASAFQAAWEAGSRMTFEQAVAYAVRR
jgi:predicted ATPase/transcriptional regulator with XRE-family HTH domain